MYLNINSIRNKIGSSLEKYTSDNTTQHEYNTTQHEATRVQYDTTRVQRDPTEVQRKLWQQK